MSKHEKLIQELLKKPTPKNFSWSDLATLLNRLGYKQLEGSGSRVKFWNEATNHVISLHKPHPHPNVKPKSLDQVKEALIAEGLI